MPKIAILIGLLLIALGVGTYIVPEPAHRSPTALIPSAAGLLLGICGAIALKANLRMHAMHGAAMVGVFSFFAAVGAIIKRSPQGLALFSMSTMAVLSLLFTILCVRSFIVARRNRLAGV